MSKSSRAGSRPAAFKDMDYLLSKGWKIGGGDCDPSGQFDWGPCMTLTHPDLPGFLTMESLPDTPCAEAMMMQQAMDALMAKAAKAEREACARVADDAANAAFKISRETKDELARNGWSQTGQDFGCLADEIRSRGA
ncbi:MAG: hypothetical protein JKY94_17395 [Rhodobacteraceae bacterium]|nr:hypothetical protein [Paracoccaceae bacterium]